MVGIEHDHGNSPWIFRSVWQRQQIAMFMPQYPCLPPFATPHPLSCRRVVMLTSAMLGACRVRKRRALILQRMHERL
jgi:hypothetical protein